eukprot:m.164350 g.164350  ORF g.164350 m.164350 type:complete len:104 (+) comp18111_c0_seq74:1110-1421(+)
MNRAVSSDDVFRFSLVRDPVSRAISGWKSKLACDSTGYHIDRRDRPVAIRELCKLSGSPYLMNASCLELDQFADELNKIKYAICSRTNVTLLDCVTSDGGIAV